MADYGSLSPEPVDVDLFNDWVSRAAKQAWGAIKFPGEVYRSQEPVTSAEMVGPAADLAGMVMGSTFFGAPRGALGSGPVPKQWKTYETTAGGRVTDYKDAFEAAREAAESVGYEVYSASGQSPSLYLKRPGDSATLRISDHPNRHPGANEVVFEARLTPIREEIINRWNDPIEGEIIENEYRNVINETPDQIIELVRNAIQMYENKKK